MDQILQQWKQNNIMHVNESIQTKREAQKTQKNQTCLPRKKQNDLIAFINKRVIEKNTPTEVSQLQERHKRVYITEGGKQVMSCTN